VNETTIKHYDTKYCGIYIQQENNNYWIIDTYAMADEYFGEAKPTDADVDKYMKEENYV
jgi:hypothetical protein